MQKKKLLGTALALAIVFPSSQASAEILKNLKVDGQYDFAGVSADNVTDFATGPDQVPPAVQNNRDKIGSMQNRFIVGVGFDLLDDVHSKVTLVNNDRVYGNNAQNLNGLQTAVLLQEANLKIDKVFGAVDTTLGRQFYGNAGDLVAYYGPRNDYGLTTTALDSVRFDWAGEMVGLTAIFGKETANGGALGPAQADDVDTRGIIASLKGHENLSAGAYVWNQMTRRYAAAVGAAPQGPGAGATNGGRNQNLWVAGLKGKLTMGGLWAGAEFAKNFGDQRATQATAATVASRKFTGWAFLADVGAKLDVDGIAAFTPWAQLGMGTGDENSRDRDNKGFQSIATDYRPGALYGRFHQAAVVNLASDPALNGGASAGLSNRIIWGLGVKATPAAASKLTTGVSFWDIRFHRATSSGVGPAVAGGAKSIGREIDVEATWAHSDNVSLTATAARFMPGSFIHESAQSTNAVVASARSGQPVNAANMLALDVRIKWGGQQ